MLLPMPRRLVYQMRTEPRHEPRRLLAEPAQQAPQAKGPRHHRARGHPHGKALVLQAPPEVLVVVLVLVLQMLHLH